MMTIRFCCYAALLLLSACSTFDHYELQGDSANQVVLNNPEGWLTTYAIRHGSHLESLRITKTAEGQRTLLIPAHQQVEIHTTSTRPRHGCENAFTFSSGEHKQYVFEPQIIDAQLFKGIQCPINVFEQDAHGDLILVQIKTVS